MPGRVYSSESSLSDVRSVRYQGVISSGEDCILDCIACGSVRKIEFRYKEMARARECV